MREIIAAVRCPDYRLETVEGAVRRIFELCGIAAFPGPVLLKPNMLSARPPEDGVTTHPAVVEAVCGLAPAGSLVGDSPASSRKAIAEYWDACGYAAAVARSGTGLVRFERARMFDLSVGGTKLSLPLAEQALSLPILNLPKLKTHNLTLLTGPVKNFYGLIPGYYKSTLHGRFTGIDEFSDLLAGIYLLIRDRVFFNLVDAVMVMEGNGPANGELRRAGYLVGGRDAFACEMVCARLLGIPPADLPLVQAFRRRGLALPEPEMVGDRLVPLADFRRPAGFDVIRLLSHPLMGRFRRFLGGRFRLLPEINPAACRRCGRCREVCPEAAISENFKIQRARCVRCLCCFEVCPHRAVKLKKSVVARFFGP